MNIKSVELLPGETFVVVTDLGERFVVGEKISLIIRGAIGLFPWGGEDYPKRPIVLPAIPEEGAGEMVLDYGTDDPRVMALAILAYRIVRRQAAIPEKPELPPLHAAVRIVEDFRKAWQAGELD
jgi:hypothetical protein